jgi:hypothetical protein
MPRIEYIPQVTPDGRIVLRGVVAPTPGERLRRLLRALRGGTRR